MSSKTLSHVKNNHLPQASLFDSEAFLRVVTEQAGVYRMYDDKQVVIYVCKAKDLKKRLASYFRKDV
jgi:excinuclease ABC subunit C